MTMTGPWACGAVSAGAAKGLWFNQLSTCSDISLVCAAREMNDLERREVQVWLAVLHKAVFMLCTVRGSEVKPL